MTSGGELIVTVGGRDVGLSAVLQKVEREMQRSGDSAVRLGQQYARLAVAQGQPALGSQILAGTLARAGNASERAIIGVETQAARLASSGGALSQFGSSAASSLTGIIGPAALATAAIGGVIAVGQSFADAFAFKAELDATTLAVNAQLKGVRDSGAVWEQASAFANTYKLTQQETTQAIAASIGVMRASKAPIEDILGVLARMQVLSPEQSLQEAAIALKALASGDTTSLVTRFEVGRDVATQMKQEIQGGADAVAVMSKFLGDTGIGMDVLAAKTTGAMGAIKDVARAEEELKLAQAEWAQGPGIEILETKIRVLSGATRILSGDFAAMGASLHQAIAGSSDDIAQMNADMDQLQGIQSGTAVTAAVAADAQNAYTRTILEGGTQAAAAAAQEDVLAAATAQAANVTAQAAQVTLVSADAQDRIAAATNTAAAETLAKAQADQVAAVDAQTHKVAEDALAATAQAAAQALLNAGAAGAGAAAQLAGSSSSVDVLTAAYYRLAAAQAAAKAADPLGGVSEGRSERDTVADRAKVKSDQALESNRKLLASIAATTRATARGGGGGGGVKLSDQQKLNNTLLADQDKANDQFENAELEHAKTMLKIQRDYQEKSLEQQRSNEVSKRQSQADFYDRLTSSDLNKSQAGKAALSQVDADYQAAYQKSQELSQAGNAKLAAEYLALKQKQVEQELTFAENVRKAAEEKDKGEVGRLTTIQQLRRSAAAEEEKNLLAGGDANVQARDEATRAANAQLEEAQGKVADSAERAAERKILAAERAGKLIDTEQAKLTTLGQTYDKLAPVRGTQTTGGAPAAEGALAPPIVAVPPPGAAQAEDPIAVAVNGARDAIVGALAAVEKAARDTTGAVRSLKASGGVAG